MFPRLNDTALFTKIQYLTGIKLKLLCCIQFPTLEFVYFAHIPLPFLQKDVEKKLETISRLFSFFPVTDWILDILLPFRPIKTGCRNAVFPLKNSKTHKNNSGILYIPPIAYLTLSMI